jgi:UDP-2,3-diacylglucosamine pyrophosphatase LpxH
MVINQWYGPDLRNLLIQNNKELYRLYGPYLARDVIRRTANKYRRLFERGKIAMPAETYPYDPEKEPERIAERRAKSARNLGKNALKTVQLVIPEEHLTYHEKLQEVLSTEGRVDKATFREGSHQGFIKNADNEIELTPELPNKRMEFSVSFDTEPKWPPVNRVESVKLPKRERKESDALRTSKKAVIIPDLQIPHHDEKAVEVALEIVRDVKPDKITILGDPLDLAAFSKYEQRPEFASQTQEAINYFHQLLVKLRKLAPSAEIVVLEGNHDARLTKSILKNSMNAFGLKRADEPEGWPVMSVPYLCAFDQLDVEYLAGYPANRYWINENLQVRHGQLARKGNTAVEVAREERVSTIFGHVHRVENQYLTYTHYSGGKTIGAWSIGCLCKIDGSVPSTKNGYDLEGRPVTNYENWQQGLAVVDYEDGDGAFSVQAVYINTFDNYKTVYGGKVYEAK